MALKTCTRPAGSVGAYAKVEIRLSQDTIVTAGGANYLALPIEITAAADGSYSVQLQATNDLTPNGTYYSVSEYGGITDSTYFVQVPQSAGPFVLTSIQVNVPPAPAPVGAAHVASLLVDGAATVSGALEAGSSTSIDLLASIQTITALKQFGTGDNIDYLLGGLGLAQQVDMRFGTSAAPITTGLGPVLKVSRFDSIPETNMPVGVGANNQGNATIWAAAQGDVNTQAQVSGLYGSAVTASTQNTHNDDALGVSGHGMVTGTGTGYGIGGYFEGRRRDTANGANGIEARSSNFTGVDDAFVATTASKTMGFWATAGGGTNSAAAYVAGNGGGNAWHVAFGAVTGSAVDYFAYDNSGATNGILLAAARSGYGMAIASGSGALLVGATSAQSSQELLELWSASGTSRDPIMRAGSSGASDSFTMRLKNGTAEYYYAFIAGFGGAFLTGTATGDTGTKVSTAAKAWHVGGTTKVLTVTGGDLFGAFAKAPVAQQSGTPAAASDLATVITLANFLRTSLLNYGWVA